MGKYPVISISLKGINAAAYEDAFDFAVQIMQRTAEEFQFLSDSEYLSEHDKSVYRELLDSNMSETVFCGGLKILSKLLEKHYRLKGFLLIDEYDVPLAKAFENGYYEQMIFQDYVNVFPENYWINTSSNDAVKKFIQMSDNLKTKREIETLLAGGEIIKEIHQELIYPEMYQSLEGAKVKVVAELLPYSGGLQRNIVQCLEDFDIPLSLKIPPSMSKKRFIGVN